MWLLLDPRVSDFGAGINGTGDDCTFCRASLSASIRIIKGNRETAIKIILSSRTKKVCPGLMPAACLECQLLLLNPGLVPPSLFIDSPDLPWEVFL